MSFMSSVYKNVISIVTQYVLLEYTYKLVILDGGN